MNDPIPRKPARPLIWPEIVLALRELVSDSPTPVYLVGGAVRDVYMRRPVKDIDLATGGDSIKLARVIANRLEGDIFVLDAERGVARVLVDTADGRFTLDVARFRGDDLLADLTDRDFTINAMAVEVRGDLSELIDPLGAEQDIARKQIRRCSPRSLSDDPIRALRAVRQSVQLGMRIEPETARDIRSYGSRLVETSPERVRDELVNLLNVARPAAALRVADALGLLKLVIPETGPEPGDGGAGWQHTLTCIEFLADILLAISPLRTDHTGASFQLGMLVMQLDRYRARLQEHLNTAWPNRRPHRALLALAALLVHTSSEAAVGERADALRFSNAEKQRLLTIVQNVTLPDSLDSRSIYRFWRQRGEAGIDICLMVLADHLAAKREAFDQGEWLALVEQTGTLLEAYFEKRERLVAPPPLLDGDRLMAGLDLQPGPLVGELLEAIREEQAAGTVDSVEEALRFAQARLERGR